MTEEQLKKANEIAEKINQVKDLMSNVHAAHRLSLYWVNNDYQVPIEVPSKYIDMVKEAYTKELTEEVERLQKQFDEL